jgi:FKBP-type peptidyl-prolyl cis-trans isomerase SlyD
MNTENMTVDDNLVVTLDYQLKLEDGEEIDRSDSGDPFQFLQGHGQIIPGLEKELYGMQVGEEKQVTVAPADGYGEIDPSNRDSVPRNIFPADMELEKGQQLQLRDQNSGQIYQATVTEIKDEDVDLDFNHPLAGETLIFQVKIADLRSATSEELEHGHVHHPGQDH